MKTVFTAAAAALFAANVCAAEFYHEFAQGNPDLFEGDGSQTPESTGKPDIYKSFSANPDLQFRGSVKSEGGNRPAPIRSPDLFESPCAPLLRGLFVFGCKESRLAARKAAWPNPGQPPLEKALTAIDSRPSRHLSGGAAVWDRLPAVRRANPRSS